MAVTLSIRKVPAPVVQRLRRRAMRHHRPLQDELLALVDVAAREEEAGLIGPGEALAAARAAGIGSCGRSAGVVRRMLDARGGRVRR